MTSLRPIKPLTLPADVPRATDFGDTPQRVMVDPLELLVDDEYQRDINRKSHALIVRMCGRFRWAKYKTPTCVRVDDKLHVIDGQHTAIAAATLGIKKIPVDVVDAATGLERADAFVAHNRDRLGMTPFDIHRAMVAVGDPAAKAIETTCRAAGVRIIRVLNKMVTPKVGDTAAIGMLGQLVKRRGAQLVQFSTTPLPEQPPGVSLAESFGVVPFSVINAREGWWQDRKRAWLALGIQSEVGRGENLIERSPQELFCHLTGIKYDKARKIVTDAMKRDGDKFDLMALVEAHGGRKSPPGVMNTKSTGADWSKMNDQFKGNRAGTRKPNAIPGGGTDAVGSR